VNSIKKKLVLYIVLILVVIVVLGIGRFIAQYAGSAGSLVPLFFGKETTIDQRDNGLPLRVPDGFSISIFAEGIEKPRVLQRDPAGNIIVSLPSEGKVVALPDRNTDGVADEVVIVADGLNRPHGIAARCYSADEIGVEFNCHLYIAETDKVSYFEFDRENLKAINRKKIFDLPGGGNHFTRTILFMPYPNEDTLLTSIGSSCNVCKESDSRRAAILASDFLGGNIRIFATGIRNAVFMAIHPISGAIWATEMGRDWLGDDLPPDEINIITENSDYGWPYCYGKNVRDSDFSKDKRLRCNESVGTLPSYIDIPAHSSPLGLAFIPEEGWPEEYWYDLLVAYHGSWNRSEPTGYKVVRFDLDEQGNVLDVEDFITGWLTDEGNILGRPVDIMAEPGGTLYISDDYTGVIYKMVRL